MILCSFYLNKLLYNYTIKHKPLIISNTWIYTNNISLDKKHIFKELVPPWELVKDYKNKIITEEEYSEYYNINILNTLNVVDIVKKIDNCILLCHCHPKKFCHRHLVKKWLVKNNYFCYELPWR